MIDKATLDQIFATKENRKRKPEGKGKVFIRSDEGLATETIQRMGDYDLGQHIGRVGSMRRSRKGQTRRMPNGSRKYMSPAAIVTHSDNEVVAYRLK